MTLKPRQNPRDDLVVVGHPFAPIGMGEHVRATWRSLKAAGSTLPLLDLFSLQRHKDSDLERELGPHVTEHLSRRTNLFCINADEVEPAMTWLDSGRFDKAYNIIYPAWELAIYPEPWARILERFDEVWAASAFTHAALKAAINRPVTHLPLAVEPALSGFLGRRYFGIPEQATVFLFSFDFSSFAERKNPLAVLTAFERLVAQRPDAALYCVIKFKGTGNEAVKVDLESRIAALGDRVQAIRRELTNNEMKNLIRCCDAFVSLHRSEGFGFGMAEAMALGRIAIATRYSGNLDFMTDETSLLVDQELIAVGPDDYLFPKGQVWADPSVDHAVQLMARVLDDVPGTRAMGQRARTHIRNRFSGRARGLAYADRLSAIEAKRAPA